MVILITLGLLARIQVNPVYSFSFVCLFQTPNIVYLPYFSASIHPHITEELEAFIYRVIEILLE